MNLELFPVKHCRQRTVRIVDLDINQLWIGPVKLKESADQRVVFRPLSNRRRFAANVRSRLRQQRIEMRDKIGPADFSRLVCIQLFEPIIANRRPFADSLP